MIKLSKFYIIAMCAALALTGCTQRKSPSDNKENQTAVVENGIDYLSVEELPLEPGTEIAMIATDASNDFYSVVKKRRRTGDYRFKYDTWLYRKK